MIRKLSIIILLIFLITCSINAQEKDSIIVDYSFWGNDFYVGGKEYTRGEIVDILKQSTHSQKLMRTSSTKKTWGYITMTAGVILTGRTLYDTYRSFYRYGQIPPPNGGSSYLYMAVITFGLDLSAIILFSESNKSFKKAIKIYNQYIAAPDHSGRYELDLKCDLNRVTLTLKF